MQYSVAQQSNQGGRDYNEDCTAIFERHNSVLLIVADGLGGHAGGELASQTFVDAMGESFKKATDAQLDHAENFFSLSINFAHHMIHRRAAKHGYAVDAPKTTCVACLIHDEKVTWAHSGDSRLYHINRREILTVTKDHITKKLAANVNNPINRCVGGLDLPKPDISETRPLEQGDIFVLATDGAWHTLQLDDLRDYVDPQHPTLGLNSLLQKLEHKNKAPSDNLSMVVFFWGIKQLDKAAANDFDEENSINLISEHAFGRISKIDDDEELEKFNIESLQDTIMEIENFISDLDDKI